MLKGGQALEQAAKGSDGITIPGAVQKCLDVALGHGLLVKMAVVGWTGWS